MMTQALHVLRFTSQRTSLIGCAIALLQLTLEASKLVRHSPTWLMLHSSAWVRHSIGKAACYNRPLLSNFWHESPLVQHSLCGATACVSNSWNLLAVILQHQSSRNYAQVPLRVHQPWHRDTKLYQESVI